MKSHQPPDATDLRRRAEERLKRQGPKGRRPATEPVTARLVHELQVHQIELELQNEELRQAYAQAETLLAEYTDLYDMAPTGYLTLDPEGTIRQVNLTGARLLGVERSQLLGRRLGLFVAEGDRRVFSDFLQNVFASNAKECCEVTLPQGSRPLIVWIEATRSGNGQECRAIVLDVTERRRAEEAARANTALLQIAGRAARLGGWSVNLMQNRVFWSDQVAAIHEEPPGHVHSLEEGIGYYAPEWREKIAEVFGACAREGRPFDEEMEIITARGRRVWVRAMGEALRDGSGTITTVQGAFQDITERMQAEKALHASLSRQQALLDAVPDIIMEVDSRKTYTWANQAGLEFFGEDVIGRDAASYFEGEQDTYTSVAPLFRGDEQVFYLESWQRRRDGQKRLLAWWCRTLKNAEGTVTGALSAARDITERNRMEEALRESEVRLRDVIFSAADWMWEVDQNGVYTYTSPKGLELFGDVIGKTPFDFMPPDEAERVAATFSQIVANKAPIKDLENWNIRKDGERVCLLTNGVPMLDEAGNLKGYRGVDRDITERKRAEMALRESEQNYREIFNAASDAIFVHDANSGAILDVNDAMLRMFGFSLEEARRLTPNDSSLGTSPYSGAEAARWMADAAAKGPQVFEWRARKKGGELFWVEMVLRSAEIAGQRRVLALARDISERKRAEAEVQSTAALLLAQLDATMDGILIVDEEGRKVIQNRRCVELWKIPKDVADNCDDRQQIEFVKNRTKDPAQFLDQILYLYAHPEETSHDELEFRDGTILDRYSAPVVGKEGTRFGRIWVFRDITERKQAEEKIGNQLNELQRWHDVMIDREDRVREVKREVNDLLARLGEPPRYLSVAEGQDDEALD